MGNLEVRPQWQNWDAQREVLTPLLQLSLGHLPHPELQLHRVPGKAAGLS